MSFLFIENAKKAWERIGAGFLCEGKEYQVFDFRHGNFKIAVRYLRGEIKY